MRAKWQSIRPRKHNRKAITDVLHLACLIWHFCGGTAGGRFDASAGLPPASQHREKGKATWLYFLVAACSTVWDKLHYQIFALWQVASLKLQSCCTLQGVFCTLLAVNQPFLAVLLSTFAAWLEKSAVFSGDYYWGMNANYRLIIKASHTATVEIKQIHNTCISFIVAGKRCSSHVWNEWVSSSKQSFWGIKYDGGVTQRKPKQHQGSQTALNSHQWRFKSNLRPTFQEIAD